MTIQKLSQPFGIKIDPVNERYTHRTDDVVQVKVNSTTDPQQGPRKSRWHNIAICVGGGVITALAIYAITKSVSLYPFRRVNQISDLDTVFSDTNKSTFTSQHGDVPSTSTATPSSCIPDKVKMQYKTVIDRMMETIPEHDKACLLKALCRVAETEMSKEGGWRGLFSFLGQLQEEKQKEWLKSLNALIPKQLNSTEQEKFWKCVIEHPLYTVFIVPLSQLTSSQTAIEEKCEILRLMERNIYLGYKLADFVSQGLQLIPGWMRWGEDKRRMWQLFASKSSEFNKMLLPAHQLLFDEKMTGDRWRILQFLQANLGARSEEEVKTFVQQAVVLISDSLSAEERCGIWNTLFKIPKEQRSQFIDRVRGQIRNEMSYMERQEVLNSRYRGTHGE